MIVNIAEAKAKLSELVEAAARGETVVICNRNQPVAELKPIESARKTPRDLSPIYPDWTIDPAFFEPLSDEELAQWYGGDPSEVPSRLAEKPANDGMRGRRRKR
ncbi:MAG: type II toxin-antitoxin system Phd/YefM family antitoxin [Vicinamibacterales bacterium]